MAATHPKPRTEPGLAELHQAPFTGSFVFPCLPNPSSGWQVELHPAAVAFSPNLTLPEGMGTGEVRQGRVTSNRWAPELTCS